MWFVSSYFQVMKCKWVKKKNIQYDLFLALFKKMTYFSENF